MKCFLTNNGGGNVACDVYKSLTLLWLLLFPALLQAQNVTLTIHLRGVYESKISLLPLNGKNTLKPVVMADSIKNGETIILKVTREYLPGEFVLRFDYKENISSTPYPSEKQIIIYNQNLDLFIHPVYSNNNDSTWFQKDEKENTAYGRFLQEDTRQRAMLGLLQNFLLNYEDTKSKFFNNGITEYEKRRKAYNQWITSQINQYKSLFMSCVIGFQYIPKIEWKSNEADRKQSLRDNYFEETDFSEPLMLKTTKMKEWMDGYVNLYGERATSVALRDSLFTLAGKTAIDRASTGHPLVYGWMVDYFFKGYESFNIEKGIKMLEPYLNDPNCLTAKRQEINKRLKGIESLVPGTIAPNIIMHDIANKQFELNTYSTEKKYILLLFWSADCNHCKDMVGKLYPWYHQAKIQNKLDILAISMDETDSEIQLWQQKVQELNDWIHLRATEGLRSRVANDYYILGVPVIILLDAKTKEIIDIPESAEQLEDLMDLK